jgi:site-specific DNA-cytosine methylase
VKLGGLCFGYGGLDMAVQQVIPAAELAWYSEIDKGANKIAAHRFPGVPNVGDMTKVDWSTVEPVDILTGGTPCQDLSHAGKRAGMTEGTRSNLWVAMREAIATLRPSLVVWENVRGAYSAEADSDLGSRPGLLDSVRRRPGEPVLRALARVLGDLSSLGYDARWHGLRAADVGAPHGRFRVFVVAYPAHSERLRRGTWWDTAPAEAARGWSPTVTGRPDRVPEPALLPTPAVNDMGEGKTPDVWDEWTAAMQAAHGNGNGHGKSLAIEAQRLLPTPTARDLAASGGSTPSDITLTDAIVRTHLGTKGNPRHADPAEGGSTEVLRGVRSGDDPQAVPGRETREQEQLPEAPELLTGLREHTPGSDPLRTRLASEGAPEAELRDMRHDGTAARSPQGPELGERRPSEPANAVPELPPQTALAGGPDAAASHEATQTRPGVCDLRDIVPSAPGESADVLAPMQATPAQSTEDRVLQAQPWGVYEAAVHRWEMVLGRVAPPPTVLSKKGTAQLSARFSEFMMGLPDGWVTGVPGITRNEALKALGNGVVPAQAAAALRFLLGAGTPPIRAGGDLLPTPRATRGGSNTETVSLLPTPRASDGEKGGPNQRGSSGDLMLPSAVMHLDGGAA